jgi:hypothetical protein
MCRNLDRHSNAVNGFNPLISNRISERIALLAFFFGLTSVLTQVSAAPTKFPVPFQIQTAGSTATFSEHVSWLTRKYPRDIAMMIILPADWKDASRSDWRPKYDALIQRLTGLRWPYAQTQRRLAHRGIRARVTWTDERSKQVLKVRDVLADNPFGRIKFGYGYAFDLDGMLLPVGNYLITVTALVDDPRFDGTFRTAIFAGYTWK